MERGASSHPQERSLDREAALPQATRKNFPPVDQIQKYRPADPPERSVKQVGCHIFIGGNDWSDLGSDSTRPRQHEAGLVLGDQSKLWQSTDDALQQKTAIGAEGVPIVWMQFDSLTRM